MTSTPWRAHEELHRLVDRLTPEQARRLLRRAEAELLAAAPPVRRRLALAGIGASGDGHLAERVEDLLAERFNRPV